MIIVYHVSDDAPHGYAFREHDEPWDERKEHYTQIGSVKTDDLQAAFELTNTVHRPWTQNLEVETDFDRVRSTSVGDVFVTSDGDVYEVGSFGFNQIK